MKISWNSFFYGHGPLPPYYSKLDWNNLATLNARPINPLYPNTIKTVSMTLQQLLQIIVISSAEKSTEWLISILERQLCRAGTVPCSTA